MSHPATETHAGKPTIAVVDDDRSVLRAVSRVLRTAGYSVRAFGSAAAYLDERESAGAQCLIVDVQMPGMSGFELGARLLDEGEAPPVLYITAHDTILARRQADGLHASGFLIKPFDPQLLLRQVAALTTPAPSEVPHP